MYQVFERDRPSEIGSRATWFILAIPIVLSIFVQVWAASNWAATFDADEAILGLMTLRLLEGEFSPYFWGQSYIGSIEPLIAAPFFAIFGPSVPALRMGTIVPFTLFLVGFAIILRRSFGTTIAFFALLATALPSYYMIYYINRTYAAMAVLLAVAVWSVVVAYAPLNPTNTKRAYGRAALLGLLFGFGLWAQPQTSLVIVAVLVPLLLASPEWQLVRDSVPDRIAAVVMLVLLIAGVSAVFSGICDPGYRAVAVPAGAIVLAVVAGGIAGLLVKACTRKITLATMTLCMAAGGVIGYLPALLALGSGLEPESAMAPSCITITGNNLLRLHNELLPALFGISWPWSILSTLTGLWPVTLAGSILAIVLVGIGIYVLRTWFAAILLAHSIAPGERDLVALIVLFLLPLVLAVFSANFIGVESVRYLLFTWLGACVLIGVALATILKRSAAAGTIVFLLWIATFGTFGLQARATQWAIQNDRYAPDHVNDLKRFLSEHRVNGGYADYWVAYPITFLTAEKPPIGVYNPGIRRQTQYEDQAEHAPNLAIIFGDHGRVGEDTSIETLVEDMRDLRPWTGPVDRALLNNLVESDVLARRSIGMWDVWVVSY